MKIERLMFDFHGMVIGPKAKNSIQGVASSSEERRIITMKKQHRVFDFHGMYNEASTARDGADDEEGLLALAHGVGKGRFRRLMREVLAACEEAEEVAAFERAVIADRAFEHRILCFERVEHRANRRRSVNVQSDLTLSPGQCAQVEWDHNSDHVGVRRYRSTVSENNCVLLDGPTTAAIQRRIGFSGTFGVYVNIGCPAIDAGHSTRLS